MMVHEYNDHGCRPMSVLNLAGFLARSVRSTVPEFGQLSGYRDAPGDAKVVSTRSSSPFHLHHRYLLSTLQIRFSLYPELTGLPFPGGPFLQAGPLAELGRLLRDAGLTVVTYTGFTSDQIAKGNDPAWPALLAATDLLISGPYIETCAGPDILKGSTNQQVIPLGTKLECANHGGISKSGRASTELTITPEGTIITTGFPSPEFVDKIASRCRGE